jgi:hypothetical protein
MLAPTSGRYTSLTSLLRTNEVSTFGMNSSTRSRFFSRSISC